MELVLGTVQMRSLDRTPIGMLDGGSAEARKIGFVKRCNRNFIEVGHDDYGSVLLPADALELDLGSSRSLSNGSRSGCRPTAGKAVNDCD